LKIAISFLSSVSSGQHFQDTASSDSIARCLDKPGCLCPVPETKPSPIVPQIGTAGSTYACCWRGGHGALISDGRAGYLFPHSDSNPLAKAFAGDNACDGSQALNIVKDAVMNQRDYVLLVGKFNAPRSLGEKPSLPSSPIMTDTCPWFSSPSR
jgi:hypothetical protein